MKVAMRRHEFIPLKFEVLTHISSAVAFQKHATPMRKSNLRVSHASLLKRLTKQWNVCVNLWQKLQSTKNEII